MRDSCRRTIQTSSFFSLFLGWGEGWGRRHFHELTVKELFDIIVLDERGYLHLHRT